MSCWCVYHARICSEAAPNARKMKTMFCSRRHLRKGARTSEKPWHFGCCALQLSVTCDGNTAQSAHHGFRFAGVVSIPLHTGSVTPGTDDTRQATAAAGCQSGSSCFRLTLRYSSQASSADKLAYSFLASSVSLPLMNGHDIWTTKLRTSGRY